MPNTALAEPAATSADPEPVVTTTSATSSLTCPLSGTSTCPDSGTENCPAC